MKMPPPRLEALRRRTPEAGFNMIEVTLAMGIVAVALVAILGLMPSGMTASRRVQDETIIANLAGDMLHWRRVTPYEQSPYMPRGVAGLTNRPPGPGTVVTNYFDANGFLRTNELNQADARYSGPYFRFIYAITNHPQFTADLDIAQVVITVEWPLINTGVEDPPPVLAANKKTRVFVSQYTRTP